VPAQTAASAPFRVQFRQLMCTPLLHLLHFSLAAGDTRGFLDDVLVTQFERRRRFLDNHRGLAAGDNGNPGFQRYVGWCVITRNLFSNARYQERRRNHDQAG
jgi:hypothetical protein